MSDPMGAIKQNMSIFNPADAMKMGSTGQITPDMTVKDFLAQVGVDVNGPVSQLTQVFGQQMQKANPLNKMQNIARAGGPSGMPPQGGPPQGQPPRSPGLEELIG